MRGVCGLSESLEYLYKALSLELKGVGGEACVILVESERETYFLLDRPTALTVIQGLCEIYDMNLDIEIEVEEE